MNHGRGRASVGCSGWLYRDWRGIVYPEALPTSRWLPYYASLFSTVELNSTFYRLPRPTTVSGWAEKAPPGFVFAVKLGSFGSHRMKLRDAARWLPNHTRTFELLGDHLGPTLVQLPPRWRCNADRLDEFLSAIPRRQRWAVELREPSWLDDRVFDVLRRHGTALCVHDLLEAHPFVLTAPWTYVRFHGPEARTRPYRGRYGGRRLWRMADKLTEVLEQGGDVYCYFNNDYEGHAVADARWLAARLGDAGAASVTGRGGLG
jgi:uncharacterized protein YecE (DUF72 family)